MWRQECAYLAMLSWMKVYLLVWPLPLFQVYELAIGQFLVRGRP